MLGQRHRSTNNSRRTRRSRRSSRRRPQQAGQLSQRGASGRKTRFESAAAAVRFRHTRGLARKRALAPAPFDRRDGLRARRRARYGHASSRHKPWAGQRPAALGRTAFNVAVLSLLGWALVWFFASDRFYVSQIVVRGNGRLSTDVIREASGLQGYSSFWIHPQQTAARVRELLPPIESVQVHHGLSNTVTLLVKERGEQIMWQMSGMRYWVDENGHLRPVRDEGQPLAAGQAPAQQWTLLVNDIRPNPGMPSTGALSVEPDAFVAAREIIHLLPEVRVVEYAPATGFRFLHPRGWLVYLGTGEDMARKASVLRAIEVQFADRDAPQPTLIDLRYPESPYYRLPVDALPESEGN